jgi:HSP20 family protein
MSNLAKRGSLFPTFGSVFDDFFNKDLFDWSTKNFSEVGSTLPSVNVKESDSDYKIELAAPGLKKEDFKVELDHHVLTISSEKKEEKEEKDEKGNYTRREFNYSSFRRSFTLPEESIESGQIEAAYQDGILKITVPKKAPSAPKTSKTIEVK